jgi:hypothetical protein
MFWLAFVAMLNGLAAIMTARGYGSRPSPGRRGESCVHHIAPCSGPSVIAARKSICVSGRFGGPRSRLREGWRNAERRTLVTAAAYFPDRRETEAHGNPSGVPPAAFLSLGPCFRQQARDQLADPGRFPHPSPAPVQPLKAAPRSGHGRLPKASRVRGARPPRPQAPHPAPRYKRPGNAPRLGRDRKEFSLARKTCQATERLNF